MARATDIQQGRLKLIKNAKSSAPTYGLRTIDLFSGAGGITEGFRQARVRMPLRERLYAGSGEDFQG